MSSIPGGGTHGSHMAPTWFVVWLKNRKKEKETVDTLEKEMATHSSVLAWRIPGTGETGGLLSMGSHRVGHN